MVKKIAVMVHLILKKEWKKTRIKKQMKEKQLRMMLIIQKNIKIKVPMKSSKSSRPQSPRKKRLSRKQRLSKRLKN